MSLFRPTAHGAAAAATPSRRPGASRLRRGRAAACGAATTAPCAFRPQRQPWRQPWHQGLNRGLSRLLSRALGRVLSRALGRALAAALAAVALAGCTTRVAPPAAVERPSAVAIVDHGRHASLVLQAGDGAMLRYAYGDRDWFALRRTGAVEAGTAILVPSPAVLGRRRLEGPMTETGIDRAIAVGIEEIHLLTVEAAEARALIDRLDAIFFAAPAPVAEDVFGLDFAPHPVPYRLSHNSNVVVADWLEALGCTVTGPRMWSVWALTGRDGR